MIDFLARRDLEQICHFWMDADYFAIGLAHTPMITVHVKLFATLTERVDGYDPAKGIVLQLPQGATVADLTEHLCITCEDTAVVAIQGKVARPEDPLADGAAVRILQLGHGG